MALDPERRDIISVRLTVPPECDRWRLDHFLKHRIRRLSRTKIRAIIPKQVRFADGRPARPSSGVRGGEIIVLEKPAPVEPPAPRELPVLASDETFIAFDKPAGLTIHTTAKYWRNTVTALLRERYPDEKLQVCHRIDRETSGVLLVARGPEAASFLKQAFARRAVTKSYLALVHGVPGAAEGVIDRPLALRDSRSKLMMAVTEGGLPSVTRYRVLRAFAEHALIEAQPQTGRQHQIRVHLAALGHPIVGDKLYRASEEAFMAYHDGGLTPELLAAFDGLDRHALHAHRLGFPHPRTGEPVTITSPLPSDLAAYMESL